MLGYILHRKIYNRENSVCRHRTFGAERIMTKIRMDFVPCLLIGGLLLGATLFAGQKYVEMADERSGMVFSDTTFYVDMFGEALDFANEDDIKFKFDIAAVVLFWVGTFGSHMIGAKIGILPSVFPKRKKEQA